MIHYLAKALGLNWITGIGLGAITTVSALSGTAQLVAIGAAAGVLLALAWIARERIKKWAAGDK